jgi:hypothetical protein
MIPSHAKETQRDENAFIWPVICVTGGGSSQDGKSAANPIVLPAFRQPGVIAAVDIAGISMGFAALYPSYARPEINVLRCNDKKAGAKTPQMVASRKACEVR